MNKKHQWQVWDIDILSVCQLDVSDVRALSKCLIFQRLGAVFCHYFLLLPFYYVKEKNAVFAQPILTVALPPYSVSHLQATVGLPPWLKQIVQHWGCVVLHWPFFHNVSFMIVGRLLNSVKQLEIWKVFISWHRRGRLRFCFIPAATALWVLPSTFFWCLEESSRVLVCRASYPQLNYSR